MFLNLYKNEVFNLIFLEVCWLKLYKYLDYSLVFSYCVFISFLIIVIVLIFILVFCNVEIEKKYRLRGKINDNYFIRII